MFKGEFLKSRNLIIIGKLVQQSLSKSQTWSCLCCVLALLGAVYSAHSNFILLFLELTFEILCLHAKYLDFHKNILIPAMLWTLYNENLQKIPRQTEIRLHLQKGFQSISSASQKTLREKILRQPQVIEFCAWHCNSMNNNHSEYTYTTSHTWSSDRLKQCFTVLPKLNRTSQSNFCFPKPNRTEYVKST